MSGASKTNRLNYRSFVKQRFSMSKAYFAMMVLYTLFYIGTIIYFAVLGRARDALLGVVFLMIAPLILLIERNSRITMPPLFAAGAFLLLIGCTLGSGYDLYTYLPWWDTFLHGFGGFFFGCLGFTIFEALVGESDSNKRFFAALLFGAAFCLMIGFLWEVFEWVGSSLFGADMEEDQIVRSFHTYFLSGTHAEATFVEDIRQTVIYLGDGSTIVIDGYLDLGLIDTLDDMIVCLIGVAGYLLLVPMVFKKGGAILKALLPRVTRFATCKHDEYRRVPRDMTEAQRT